jgi:MtN3 and saliva related transmembrane protein
MSAELAPLLGFVAGTLTTAAFVPQVVKTWRTRSAHDVSLGMFAIFAAGVLLWLVYGVYIESLPIVIANSITLVLASAMIVFKLRFKRRGG